MEKCVTCKHWQDADAGVDYQYASNLSHVGQCGLTISEGFGPANDLSLAYAEADYHYHAILRTTAEFGCVQWEKKDG